MAAQKQPNIVFLFAETWPHDHLSIYGHPDVQTPNLDLLASKSINFRNCYLQGSTMDSVCIPSRAQMLTGRNATELSPKGPLIHPSWKTLPQIFMENGYVTYVTGKWHNDLGSFKRSFSHGGPVFGLNPPGGEGWYNGCDGHWHIPYRNFRADGKYRVSEFKYADGPAGNFKPPFTRYKDKGLHSSELFTDSAVEFLSNYKYESPYFAFIPYLAAHDPYQAPTRFGEMYDETCIAIPDNHLRAHPFDNGSLLVRDEKLLASPRNEAEVRRHLKDYYALISHTDEQIGRILKAISKKQDADNTWIVFSADHGIANGQHGLLGKQNLYEHSIGIPMIISGPGIKFDQGNYELCYLHDLYPTLLKLADLDVPPQVTGMNLFDRYAGSNGADTVLSFIHKDTQKAVRRDRLKLIRYRVGGCQRTQLFDLQNDPYEIEDLSAIKANREDFFEMSELLDSVDTRGP